LHNPALLIITVIRCGNCFTLDKVVVTETNRITINNNNNNNNNNNITVIILIIIIAETSEKVFAAPDKKVS